MLDTTMATQVIKSHMRGDSYLHRLLQGVESWSGSTLTGKAKKYSGTYARSRERYLKEMSQELLDKGGAGYFTDRLVLVESRWRKELIYAAPGGYFVWLKGEFHLCLTKDMPALVQMVLYAEGKPTYTMRW